MFHFCWTKSLNRLRFLHRITTLALFCLALTIQFLPYSSAFGAEIARPPNIVVILADDNDLTNRIAVVYSSINARKYVNSAAPRRLCNFGQSCGFQEN